MSNIVGIGTDIVECLRLGRLIERHGERFLRRVFTAEEIRFCSSRSLSIQNYAALWAGKEAILKALNSQLAGGISMLDVEIRQQPGETEWRVGLGGKLRDRVATRAISSVRVSTSYCRNYATGYAVAVAE
jgi:holo-[acyl-carrier protein] synthase